jgi:AraC-like DNA-binding protein
MINSRQPTEGVPLVDWQASKVRPYKLYRLEELRGTVPRDGHDPKIPHRIGFHAMMLVTDGSFEHGFDFQVVRFTKNQLIYIAPNQVHHFVKSRRAHKAFILAFQPEILPAELLQLDGERVPWSIMCYRWPGLTTLKPKETRILSEQLAFLDKLHAIAPDSNGAAARYHVCAINALAFELAKKNHDEPAEWRSDRNFLKFVELVEESYTTRRNVTWYAKQLDCSQRTLNRICHRMLGKTAKEFLSARVVIEAKRLLAYEVDSVNEVAKRLGFGATTNFARYFKQEAGVTPQEFKDPIKRMEISRAPNIGEDGRSF